MTHDHWKSINLNKIYTLDPFQIIILNFETLLKIYLFNQLHYYYIPIYLVTILITTVLIKSNYEN